MVVSDFLRVGWLSVFGWVNGVRMRIQEEVEVMMVGVRGIRRLMYGGVAWLDVE